jgi:hypothetical protein
MAACILRNAQAVLEYDYPVHCVDQHDSPTPTGVAQVPHSGPSEVGLLRDKELKMA